MVASSSLEQSSTLKGHDLPTKRRRTSKTAANRMSVSRPQIMGEVIKRYLDKFEISLEQLNFSHTSVTVPLFSSLMLPCMMYLNRIQTIQGMHAWFLAHSQDIADNLPAGTDLVEALGGSIESDIFARVLSGVHILSYEQLLLQCKAWQKQYLYSSQFAHKELDQIKFNLTQDVNEHLAKFELHYHMSLSDKAVIYLDQPPVYAQDFTPLSVGSVLQAFDAQGMVLKIKLRQCSASTLERLFVSGCHLLIELSEEDQELYTLAVNGLNSSQVHHHVSERYGLEFSFVSSADLEDPMHRARLALTGWICQVKQGQNTTLYLMWWQKDVFDNIDSVAEACHYLQGKGPRWYWTDDVQDYSRLAMPPVGQRLGRNCVLLGRFARYVLKNEYSFKLLYAQKEQYASALTKEKLQSYLDSVPASSAALMRYMLSRKNLI